MSRFGDFNRNYLSKVQDYLFICRPNNIHIILPNFYIQNKLG